MLCGICWHLGVAAYIYHQLICRVSQDARYLATKWATLKLIYLYHLGWPLELCNL